MENIIKIFANEEFGRVRTVIIKGEPWFVLADVCKALEISNSRMVASRLDSDELMSVKLTSGGQRRDMTVVSESGLYDVILEVTNHRRSIFVNGSQLRYFQQSGEPAATLPTRICSSKTISLFWTSRIKICSVCR